ncbi:metalloregulator ArsR/SmtB family transcription factor [uncultured Draconibacterium sp.]|uniref:ArsR/SmtB family transcription factor n=1 Tax=uncultured Draconibacterium sp. TaxID=1573823 RepID=UPI0025DAB358|nr:metalloregulator ArsR/SmtB family transcription factor [uncultured Draconibacterium sp.]
MVQSKTELFDRELTEQAAFFKALAHPARLRILQYLSETDTCITGDISDEIPLGRTTVNQHIKELKDAGLIQGHIEGVKTKYCLNPEKIELLKNLTRKFTNGLNCSSNTCS